MQPIPDNLYHVYAGVLFAWFETGLEGQVWALQEYSSIKMVESPELSNIQTESWDYVGLRVIERGDDLTIFDRNEVVVWQGIIQPERIRSIGGWSVHWSQKDVDPEQWMKFFSSRKYNGRLIQKTRSQGKVAHEHK